MKSYLDGELVPGERAGEFRIGQTMDEVLKLIDFEYELREKEEDFWIGSKNISFFISKKTNRVTDIYLEDEYRGKFQNQLGIGTLPSQLKGLEFSKSIADMEFLFWLSDYEGICFNVNRKALGNENEPIELIHLYDTKEYPIIRFSS